MVNDSITAGWAKHVLFMGHGGICELLFLLLLLLLLLLLAPVVNGVCYVVVAAAVYRC